MSVTLLETGVKLWEKEDYDELWITIFEQLTGAGGKSNIRLLDESIAKTNRTVSDNKTELDEKVAKKVEVEPVTQENYDLLEDSVKKNGKLYFITNKKKIYYMDSAYGGGELVDSFDNDSIENPPTANLTYLLKKEVNKKIEYEDKDDFEDSGSISILKNIDGFIKYPQTKTKCVFDEEGVSLDVVLKDIKKAFSNFKEEISKGELGTDLCFSSGDKILLSNGEILKSRIKIKIL